MVTFNDLTSSFFSYIAKFSIFPPSFCSTRQNRPNSNGVQMHIIQAHDGEYMQKLDILLGDKKRNFYKYTFDTWPLCNGFATTNRIHKKKINQNRPEMETKSTLNDSTKLNTNSSIQWRLYHFNRILFLFAAVVVKISVKKIVKQQIKRQKCLTGKTRTVLQLKKTDKSYQNVLRSK